MSGPRPRRTEASASGPLPADRAAPPSRNPVLWEVSADVEPPPHWSREVVDRWPVRLTGSVCRPSGPNGDRLLQIVEFTGASDDLAAVARYLRRAPDLSAVSFLPLASGRMYARIEGPIPAACRAVFEAGAVCTTCLLRRAPGDRAGWEFTWPGSARELGRFLRRFHPGGATPILRLRRYRPESELTGRQALAIETAFRLGYYAFPRRAHLGTVAAALHVSRSTVAELLRRAEGKLLAGPLGSPV